MHAIKFTTKIKNGYIELPKKFKNSLKHKVKVFIIEEDNISYNGKYFENVNIIDELLKSPLYLKNFVPLTREEIHERN